MRIWRILASELALRTRRISLYASFTVLALPPTCIQLRKFLGLVLSH